LLGQPRTPIGRCRSLYASSRGPEAFLNLKVSLRPQFPFLGQGVASTSTFTANLRSFEGVKVLYKNFKVNKNF